MKMMKRALALLLAVVMVLGMAACAKQPTVKQTQDPNSLSRADKELIADLIGGVDGSDMTDEELDALVDQLIGENQDQTGNIVNLNNKENKQEASVDASANKDAYDENGAMTKPFDQVYPELIETGAVAFSGESILIKLKDGKRTDGLKAAGIGALEQIAAFLVLQPSVLCAAQAAGCPRRQAGSVNVLYLPDR